MGPKLASIFTLGLLSTFVFAVVIGAMQVLDVVSLPLAIIFVVVFNFLVWLLGPYVQNFIYKFFYKITFMNPEELTKQKYYAFVKATCDKYNLKIPVFGIIHDQNPTAFTYGSASFNARIVLTEGLFTFLNDQELEAVIAHEIGHIKNKDFIIMTIASTLLQILYQIYVFTIRTSGKIGPKKGEKKENPLVYVGFVSLIFYWIGTYLVMFLSRQREYYADKFSAEETGNPNALSEALIKIAYGIASTPDTEKTAHLLNATRSQGIFDMKMANEAGLLHYNGKNRKNLVERALMFDIVSPWAWILQLKSTHPVIGKRIFRLSGEGKSKYSFDTSIVDKGRIWKNFFKEALIYYSPRITTLIILIVGLLHFYGKISVNIAVYVSLLLLVFILSVVKTIYKYPKKEFQELSVIECMGDMYASPVRGRPIKLTGKAIGRGQAGFVFGEDIMFQDKTGLMYLNYESGVPLLGNLVFAWKKLEKLLGKSGVATGWFLRGVTHHVELYHFKVGSEVIKSYVRFWAMFFPLLMLTIIAFVLFLLRFAYGY